MAHMDLTHPTSLDDLKASTRVLAFDRDPNAIAAGQGHYLGVALVAPVWRPAFS